MRPGRYHACVPAQTRAAAARAAAGADPTRPFDLFAPPSPGAIDVGLGTVRAIPALEAICNDAICNEARVAAGPALTDYPGIATTRRFADAVIALLRAERRFAPSADMILATPGAFDGVGHALS